MFCIQQFNHIDKDSLVGEIVHITNSDYEDELCKIAKFQAQKRAGANNIDVVNNDRDISKNGYYLVQTMTNGKIVEIRLIEKANVINRGYIYNTTHTQLNKIYTWKVMPYNFCNIDELNDAMQNNQVAFKNKKFTYREMEINKFDNGTICNNPCIGIIGKENMIKTCLINSIKKFCGNSSVFVFAPQNKVNLYEFTIPNAKINCDITIIKTILASQMYKTEKSKQFNANTPKITFVLDDSIFSNPQSAKDCEIINELVFNHKCYSIALVILSNGIIDANINSLLDYIFICPTSNICTKKNMYDNYFKNIVNPDIFSKIFSSISNKSYYTVIDKTVGENNANSILSWYKCSSNSN